MSATSQNQQDRIERKLDLSIRLHTHLLAYVGEIGRVCGLPPPFAGAGLPALETCALCGLPYSVVPAVAPGATTGTMCGCPSLHADPPPQPTTPPSRSVEVSPEAEEADEPSPQPQRTQYGR